jgi:hypothetical protein
VGVANTMSHRIGARLSDDIDAFLSATYGAAFDDCTNYLKLGAPLVEALQTGAFDAYYACGDLIALITEAGVADGDIFDLWAGFLGEAATSHNGAITASRYFKYAERAGLQKDLRDALDALVNEPVANPEETLLTLLKDAGLSPEVGKDGRLTSISLPQ